MGRKLAKVMRKRMTQTAVMSSDIIFNRSNGTSWYTGNSRRCKIANCGGKFLAMLRHNNDSDLPSIEYLQSE
jgi:hypothetical protein